MWSIVQNYCMCIEYIYWYDDMLHACFLKFMLCFVIVYSGEFVSESMLMFICIYSMWRMNLEKFSKQNLNKIL